MFKYIVTIIVLSLLWSCEKPDVPTLPKAENECIFNNWEQILLCRPSDSFYIKCSLNGGEFKTKGYSATVKKTYGKINVGFFTYNLDDSCTTLINLYSGGVEEPIFKGVNDTLFLRDGNLNYLRYTFYLFSTKASYDGKGYEAERNYSVVSGDKSSLSNFIVLDKINADTTIVEGSFRFDLQGYGEKFTITDGKFRLKTCRD